MPLRISEYVKAHLLDLDAAPGTLLHIELKVDDQGYVTECGANKVSFDIEVGDAKGTRSD